MLLLHTPFFVLQSPCRTPYRDYRPQQVQSRPAWTTSLLRSERKNDNVDFANYKKKALSYIAVH